MEFGLPIVTSLGGGKYDVAGDGWAKQVITDGFLIACSCGCQGSISPCQGIAAVILHLKKEANVQ